MDVAQKSGREIEAARRHGNGGLPARRAFRDALIHQPLDAIELHARDDCADVDGFIERRADAQRVHAVADFGDQFFRDALLHQQARTGAANLPLIEPDAVDQAFDGAVEIGVFENDEGRFAAQFERKSLVAGGGGFANRAANFGGSGERDLVDVGMCDERFAGRAVAGDDVHDAGGRSDFLANVREGQRGERSEFRGLQDDGISGGKRRRDFPRQHEQRKIPRNDLADDAAGGVTGKFLIEELRPAGVVIKMARDERNIDVAAFANRLAVVHSLEDGEPARMLLHLPRQRIEIACAR